MSHMPARVPTRTGANIRRCLLVALVAIIGGCGAGPEPTSGTPSTGQVPSPAASAAPTARSTAPSTPPSPAGRPTASPTTTPLGPVATTVLEAATATAVGFVRPFDYVIPVDSGIRPTLDGHGPLVAFVAGADIPPDLAPASGDPRMQPTASSARGVIVASGEEAVGHGRSARFTLRAGPAEFLADLRDTAGVHMGPTTETTLDGWPALTVMLPGIGGPDIHVGRSYVLLTIPSRLVVAEIDGTTVFILTWARTADDLAAWMPVADAFVASFRFVPEAQS